MVLAVGGCDGDDDDRARADASVDGSGGGDGAGDVRPPDGSDAVEWLPTLGSADDFARLQGEEWAVKYLGAVAGKSVPAELAHPCVFQNTARHPLHLGFLRTHASYRDLDFDTYLALTQKRASRTFWAGELKLLAGALHPRTGARGVLVFFVYSDPREQLTVDELVEVKTRLATCVPYARDLLVLVGMDSDQERSFAMLADALRAHGVDFATHAEIRPAHGAESYSDGETYGFIRLSPPGRSAAAVAAEVGPRDILIAESASEDLGVVAGLVTTLPQNVHSHLNLRLREKKIPNARVADIFADQVVATLDGRLAHLEVAGGQVRLSPATLSDAEAFWQSRRPPAHPLSANLDETRVRTLAEIGGADRAAYGSKAANLGELHRILPPAHRVAGFAVPFALVHRWLSSTGLAARIDALLADPRVKSDAVYRRAALQALRKAIEDAPLAAEVVEALAPAAAAAFGPDYARQPTRFRSSSNVEDGEQISGAGLYDSARGCFADDRDADTTGPSLCLADSERALLAATLERRRAEYAAHPERTWLVEIIDDLASDLSKERTVARALKKVWASLWNARAFEEREYHGMDHRRAVMGVAVNPSFVAERIDAVAVTQLVREAGAAPLYRVVSQSEGLPVVRPPDPTLVAETMTFRRGAMNAVVEPRVLVASSLSPEPLWPEARRDLLARLLFAVQDHFATAVYPQISNLSLDLEIKVTADDRVVIKQARPYIDVGP